MAGSGAGLTPYPEVLVLGQDQTERMLLAALAERDMAVHREMTVRDLRQHDARVDVVLRRPDGTDDTWRCRYVVGADGAHSTVRHCLGSRFVGEAHEGRFFLADVALDWNHGYGSGLTVALDNGGGVALFVPMHAPDGATDRYRIFGSLTQRSTDADHITLDDVQRRLDRRTGLRTRLHDPRWIAVYRLSSRMSEVFGVGRVFLAGDAAHIHTPIGGQGMNTGLQDAYNLAWKLSAVLRGVARPPLLDTYQAERQPVARGVLEGTDRAFEVVSSPGRLAGLVRPVLARVVVPTALRLPAAKRRAFRLISQTSVGYPTSPAVAGAGRRGVAPGDRAPWAPLATNPAADVFGLLDGTDHHLLVFPSDHPDPAAATARAVRFTETFAVTVRVHAIDPTETRAHRAYGAESPAMVLVRPDGHVAWRGPLDDLAAFAEYLGRWYLPVAPTTGVAAPALPVPGRYRIDPGASTLALTVAHWFGTGTVGATMPLVEGALMVTEEPQQTSAVAVADASGFTSGHAHRDRTVRSRRLLDTDTWPTIRYVGSGLRVVDGAWVMSGILTAHGRSHVLDLRADAILPAEVDGSYTFRCSARLDRHRLGVTGLAGIVGRAVSLDLTLHATRVDPAPASARAVHEARPHGR